MISSHVTYEVGRARIEELRLEADERRRARRESDASRSTRRAARGRHLGPRPTGVLRLRRA